MLQRNSLPLRASALLPAVAIALFCVAPHQVNAQAAQSEMPTSPAVPAVPAAPTPLATPSSPLAATMAVPIVPPAPLVSPHSVSVSTHGNSEHAQVPINGDTRNAVGATEEPRASKSPQRKQKKQGSKQKASGRQQWVMNERLRVRNEAARREADRMINAASPMDWRNRYSSE